MSTPTIRMGFAKRQTATSRFSHFEGSVGELIYRIRTNWHRMKPTYRKYDPETGVCDKYGLDFGGVVSVPMDNLNGFLSGVFVLEEGDVLAGEYKARKAGEEPRKTQGVVGGTKMLAKSADVILYHADVLAEDDDREFTHEWEIVSINASPVEGEQPIDPTTLMHNHFGSSGGTATGLTDSELVEKLRVGFLYWKDKALGVDPE